MRATRRAVDTHKLGAEAQATDSTLSQNHQSCTQDAAASSGHPDRAVPALHLGSGRHLSVGQLGASGLQPADLSGHRARVPCAGQLLVQLHVHTGMGETPRDRLGQVRSAAERACSAGLGISRQLVPHDGPASQRSVCCRDMVQAVGV